MAARTDVESANAELARIEAEFAKFVAAHAKTDAVIEKLHAGQNEAAQHKQRRGKANGDVHARNDAHAHGGAQARGEAHARSGAHKGTAGGDASGDAHAHGKANAGGKARAHAHADANASGEAQCTQAMRTHAAPGHMHMAQPGCRAQRVKPPAVLGILRLPDAGGSHA